MPESLEAATTETRRQGTKSDVVKMSQNGTQKLGGPDAAAAARPQGTENDFLPE